MDRLRRISLLIRPKEAAPVIKADQGESQRISRVLDHVVGSRQVHGPGSILDLVVVSIQNHDGGRSALGPEAGNGLEGGSGFLHVARDLDHDGGGHAHKYVGVIVHVLEDGYIGGDPDRGVEGVHDPAEVRGLDLEIGSDLAREDEKGRDLTVESGVDHETGSGRDLVSGVVALRVRGHGLAGVLIRRNRVPVVLVHIEEALGQVGAKKDVPVGGVLVRGAISALARERETGRKKHLETEVNPRVALVQERKLTQRRSLMIRPGRRVKMLYPKTRARLKIVKLKLNVQKR